MKVCVVSQDEETDSLFRRVSLSAPDVKVEVMRSGAERCAADLYVWDLAGLSDIPTLAEVPDETQHVFLLVAADLLPLHRRLPGAAIRVLLKPLQELVLTRFIEDARARWAARQQTGQEPLRSGRDDYLQCLLLASLRLQQHATDRANFVVRALQDLWAPLTAADGYCAILLHHASGALTSDQMEAARELQASVQRARRTANLLAQLSLDTVYSQPPLLAPGDVASCLEAAAAAGQASARAKEITLAKRLRPAGGTLYFDAAQIEQALSTLLENAYRFTPRGGSVALKAYPVSWGIRDSRLRGADGQWFVAEPSGDGTNAYRIDVSDQGPPVPLSAVARVFDQYSPYCGKNDRSGPGLGLATCRMAMNAHGGAAVVEPQPEGATFSLVLPYLRPEAVETAGGERQRAVRSERG